MSNFLFTLLNLNYFFSSIIIYDGLVVIQSINEFLGLGGSVLCHSRAKKHSHEHLNIGHIWTPVKHIKFNSDMDIDVGVMSNTEHVKGLGCPCFIAQ